MKEYIGEDGTPVVEYELEDIPKLKSGELLNVFGLWNTAPKSEGGGSTLFKLSIEAQAFCDAEKEDEKLTYWEKVDSRLEAAIKSFQEVLKRSPAPPETITNRIRQAKWTLNPDNDPNAPFELGINPNAHLKEAWQNLTKGIIVYSIHNYHNNQLKAHVENLFLQWLKTLQANPEPVADTVTPPQGKKGSTGSKIEQKQGLTYNLDNAKREELFLELGRYVNDPALLTKLLNGQSTPNPIKVTCQQNEFAEIFKRLKYNGLIVQPNSEIVEWLSKYFEQNNAIPFNFRSIEDLFKISGKPPKHLRCDFNWLIFKDAKTLRKEAHEAKVNAY